MDNKNKRYSFFQLFGAGSEERPANYRVVIPIIQREYAQGRNNEKAEGVRKEFLTQLLDMMETPTGSHDLDFVYGVSAPPTDNSKKREFVPLDGQQRLTTLFLIHYYLATRVRTTEIGKNFFNSLRIRSGRLSECLFTYRTRSSASEFCNNLLNEDNDFSFVFETDEEGKRISGKTLSHHIKNSNWFYPDWTNDPSVSAMLTMLDDIDKKFDQTDHIALLARLMSDEDPSVTFIFMDLDEYGLTDDLYIKMNSRGKPLTSYENFKAKLEQYIGVLEKGFIVKEDEKEDTLHYVYEEKDGLKRKYNKSLLELGQTIKSRKNPIIDSVKSNFSFNIDTDWTNIFWDFAKEDIKNAENDGTDTIKSIDNLLSETLDLKISRFIKMVLANQFATDIKKSIPTELIGEYPLSFSKLQEMSAISSDAIVSLTRMFELFSKSSRFILSESVRKKYFDDKEVFCSMINGENFTFPKRLMFYCYAKFRLQFGDSKVEYLEEWLRFMYNMSLEDNMNQTLDRNTYYRAVNAVNHWIELLDKNEPSITNLLLSERRPEKSDFFPDYQYREEILKAYLFAKNEKNIESDAEVSENPWSKTLLELESHPYFTGQIGFILKMAGIDDYFKQHGNLEWHESEDSEYLDKVKVFGGIASKVFEGGYGNRILAKEALLERAMLSAYPKYLSNNFLNSTNQRAGSNNLLRDLSWKSLLRLVAEPSKAQGYAIELLKSLNPNDVTGSLNEIIQQNSEGPQWKRDIVRYSYLMGKCTNGYFYKTEDGHRILVSRINFSKDDHEVYSLVLYWEYMHELWKKNHTQDFSLSYGNSNSSYNEVPFIRMSYKDMTLKVKSYVKKEDGELIQYYMWFDSNGDEKLQEFLVANGFTRKKEDDTIFRSEGKSFSEFKDADEYRKYVASSALAFMTKLASEFP